MNNAVEILDQGFACLVENLGVVDAEHFIALIKRLESEKFVPLRSQGIPIAS